MMSRSLGRGPRVLDDIILHLADKVPRGARGSVNGSGRVVRLGTVRYD
jgi:hypothetical protein